MQWSIAFIVLSIVCSGTIYGQCPSPDVDICQFVTCGNGNCTKDATSSQCFRCQCSAGFTGPLCETEIAAAANCGAPCQNGGRCEQKGPNAYACVCSADFIGVHCETSVISTHICSVAPQAACRNGGTCIMNGDGFLCRCTAGFTGGSCETQINGDNCPINVCLNGGICRINNNVEYCTCPSTFTGETCDIPISTLSTITPPTGSGACASNPCLNGGLCSNSGNNFVCSCPPTHVGTICETSISTVITSTTRITTTTSGSGQANSCASRPCLNGAQCYNNGNSFFCLCKQGYTGQTCASQLGSTTPSPITPSTISACASNPCNNGGSCYKFEDSFICSCTQYYTGETCDKPKVFTTTAATTPGSTVTCANQPCQNGATCYATGNSYFCFCGSNSMYTGKNCDTPKATADPACPLDCSTGYCIRTGATQNGYACMCNGVLTPSSCQK